MSLVVFMLMAVFTALNYTNAMAEYQSTNTQSGLQVTNAMTKVYACPMDKFTMKETGQMAIPQSEAGRKKDIHCKC